MVVIGKPWDPIGLVSTEYAHMFPPTPSIILLKLEPYDDTC